MHRSDRGPGPLAARWWLGTLLALAALELGACRAAEEEEAPAAPGEARPGGADAPAEAAGEKPVQYGRGRLIARLANREIDESSGVAASKRNPGVFWTHNDSGDRPRLYAFNAKGEDLGVFQVRGGAQDWEDIASVRLGEKCYLVCADVGDNAAVRTRCTLYWLEEPERTEDGKWKPPASRPLPARAIPFTYEDGARNCEAAAVDPATGAVYLVSKEGGRECQVYALPAPRDRDRPGEAPPEVARPVATLRLPTVSAMDISPDGRRAVINTYGDAYEYTRKGDETWAEAFGREPRRLAMPERRKGEGICYGPDGRTLYLTSEYLPCPFYEVPAAAGAGGEKKEDEPAKDDG